MTKWTLLDELKHARQHAGATVKARECDCEWCAGAPRHEGRMIVNAAGSLAVPPISSFHPAREVPALLANLRA